MYFSEQNQIVSLANHHGFRAKLQKWVVCLDDTQFLYKALASLGFSLGLAIYSRRRFKEKHCISPQRCACSRLGYPKMNAGLRLFVGSCPKGTFRKWVFHVDETSSFRREQRLAHTRDLVLTSCPPARWRVGLDLPMTVHACLGCTCTKVGQVFRTSHQKC